MYGRSSGNELTLRRHRRLSHREASSRTSCIHASRRSNWRTEAVAEATMAMAPTVSSAASHSCKRVPLMIKGDAVEVSSALGGAMEVE